MSQESNLNSNLLLQEKTTDLHQQLLGDCVAMMRFALADGKQVEPHIINVIELVNKQSVMASGGAFPAEELVEAHNMLARLIAPVKPQNLSRERRIFQLYGRKIPSPSPVAQLMLFATVFLLIFIITALDNGIDGVRVTEDFTTISWQNGGLQYFAFLLSLAGLGASFSALFRMNRYIKRSTFDPRHMPSYYIQLLLGIIAGLFISQLLDIKPDGNALTLFSKPTLALLGGFSSTVVYRILKQMLTAFESLVKGDTETMLETQRQLLQIDAQQMVQERRLKVATELMSLKDNQSSEFQDEMNKIIHRLLKG